MTDNNDEATIDEYLSQHMLIAFDSYLRGHRVDRKGELILTLGIPQHFRRDDETNQALADLMNWGGYHFSVILTRERPRGIPTITVQAEDD